MTEATRIRAHRFVGSTVALLVLAIASWVLGAQPTPEGSPADREPAKLVNATLPDTSPLAVGGGEVRLELEVNEEGEVADVSVLTDTPPFTENILGTVRSWSFRPAETDEGPQASRVLVVAVFREPAFYSGTSAGEPPRVIQQGSSHIPDLQRTVTPIYPARAYDDGAALVSVRVGPDGDVEEVEIVGSTTPGFEQVSLDAVRQWQFQPARIEGTRVESIAYVIIAFRQPVVPSPRIGRSSVRRLAIPFPSP